LKKGDIIVLPFPFTDLSGSKYRPAVVLIVLKNDVTVAFVSTQLSTIELSDIILVPDETNGLKKESVLKVAKIATIRKDLVTGLLGEINETEAIRLDQILKELFKLD